MLKCSRKLKIGLLMGVVYVALMAVLFTEISYAKYQEERLAYANFGAASFNSVILSADMTEGSKPFNVFDDALQLSITEYRPGMTYNPTPANDTSKKIPFVVANGVSAEDASEANVQYQIALRTTGHLPLKYSLLHKQSGETKVLYAAGETKTRIAPTTANGTVWYEQRFVEPVGDSTREVTFDLNRTDGLWAFNEYELVVEWPSNMNDTRYMKEVELLQILVTVSSKNMLVEEGYGAGVTISPDIGNGIVILDPSAGIPVPAKGDQFARYVHYLDYRAFRKETGESAPSYTLIVENGVDKQVAQTRENTEYTMEIEVPWVAATEKTSATNTFKYYIKVNGSDSVELTPVEFRLYDELYNSAGYNTYNVVSPSSEQITEWSKSSSDKRLYQVFRVSGETVENGEHTAHEYQLILGGTGTGSISDQTAFEHKIRILVEAEHTGSPLGEGGGANG